MLGNTISSFSRKYFFSAAILAMAIASSYYWSGFPFDNLCSKSIALVVLSFALLSVPSWQLTFFFFQATQPGRLTLVTTT
jgi:hypothetical protein